MTKALVVLLTLVGVAVLVGIMLRFVLWQEEDYPKSFDQIFKRVLYGKRWKNW